MNASSLSSLSACWAEDLGAEPVEADGVTPAVGNRQPGWLADAAAAEVDSDRPVLAGDRCPVVQPSAHARLSLERREHPVGLGPGAAIDVDYDTIHVLMLPDRRWP
jgi:hypothetical protein